MGPNLVKRFNRSGLGLFSFAMSAAPVRCVGANAFLGPRAARGSRSEGPTNWGPVPALQVSDNARLGSCRATVLCLPKEGPGGVQDTVDTDLFDGVRLDWLDRFGLRLLVKGALIHDK